MITTFLNYIFFVLLILFSFSCRKVYNSKLSDLDSLGDRYDTIADASKLPENIINDRLSIEGGWELKQIFKYVSNKWSYIAIDDCALDNTYIFEKGTDETTGLITYQDNILCLSSGANPILLPDQSFSKLSYIITKNKITYDESGSSKSIDILSISKDFLMLYRVHFNTGGGGASTREELIDIYMPKEAFNNIKPSVGP